MKIETYGDKRKKAWRLYLSEVLRPNVMITFNFNKVHKRPIKTMRGIMSEKSVSTDEAHRKMKDFFNMMQGKVFGRDWNEQVFRLWPCAVGFLEHPTTNLHFHVNAHLCPAMLLAIELEGPSIWEHIQPGGQLYVQVTDERGPINQIIYSTKALQCYGAEEGIFEYSKRSPWKHPEEQLRELRAAAVEALLRAQSSATPSRERKRAR